MDDQLSHRMDSLHQRMEADIVHYGCNIMGVFPTEEHPGPPFTYTIGLTDLGWPELIMVGLRIEYATQIINTIVQDYRDRAAVPAVGDLLTECSNLPLRLGSVSLDSMVEYLCQSLYRQQRVDGPVPTALQIVMCDRESNFPLDTGYDHDYMDAKQPCLADQWDYAPA